MPLYVFHLKCEQNSSPQTETQIFKAVSQTNFNQILRVKNLAIKINHGKLIKMKTNVTHGEEFLAREYLIES